VELQMMINIGVINEEQMTNVVELTVDEAIEDIEMRRCHDGITDYMITEDFPDSKQTYKVQDFHINNENDAVCCIDEEGYILEHRCAICAFLKNRIKLIRKFFIGRRELGEVQFVNGRIIIEQIIY
jgi:hypothetical protein